MPQFKFTKSGEISFLVQLKSVLKNDNQNFEIWVQEAEENYNKTGSSFEVNSQFTKNDRPILIDMRKHWFAIVGD